MAESRTVLVVEDDQFLKSLITTKLTQEGYRVLEAGDGSAALQLARQQKPDLVLLDIILPGMDGMEFLKTLRLDPSIRDVPVFVFTNLGGDDDMKTAMQAGANDYLVKAHFTPAEIARKIKEAFE